MLISVPSFLDNGNNVESSSVSHQEELDRHSLSTNLSSRWSTRSRYASKLDVDQGMDPIAMGMCIVAAAESLFEL
jgi:hypothetical protein